MKIGLKSDFRDFYDHWFDSLPCDYILYRMTIDGMAKRDQFDLLDRAGFAVPLNGLVRDVWGKTDNDYLVLYEDEFSHCGEGKELWHTTKAAIQKPDLYCSVFIPTSEAPEEKAVSRRLLAVGDRIFWLKYESTGSWMSNHATDVSVSVIGETLGRQSYAREGDHDFSELNQYPLFAIDFVESLAKKQLMAIDFNAAPGLRGTGMEDVLGSREIVDLIRSFVSKVFVK